MSKSIWLDIIGAIIVVAAAGLITYAFTGPTNAPTSGDSSSGSLLDNVAGGTFNSSTDSLEAIADKLSSMGL